MKNGPTLSTPACLALHVEALPSNECVFTRPKTRLRPVLAGHENRRRPGGSGFEAVPQVMSKIKLAFISALNAEAEKATILAKAHRKAFKRLGAGDDTALGYVTNAYNSCLRRATLLHSGDRVRTFSGPNEVEMFRRMWNVLGGLKPSRIIIGPGAGEPYEAACFAIQRSCVVGVTPPKLYVEDLARRVPLIWFAISGSQVRLDPQSRRSPGQDAQYLTELMAISGQAWEGEPTGLVWRPADCTALQEVLS